VEYPVEPHDMTVDSLDIPHSMPLGNGNPILQKGLIDRARGKKHLANVQPSPSPYRRVRASPRQMNI
jgi:hypothetical protein